MLMEKYDSKKDTNKHILDVQANMMVFRLNLINRANNHDKSKLEEPEKSGFDRETPILKDLTYGSDEYNASLARLQVALDHHYANNSHHPQHYANGIDGMSLFDICEMFADWVAATERTNSGDINKSIDYNEKRFNMSPQLASIFRNTVSEFRQTKETLKETKANLNKTK